MRNLDAMRRSGTPGAASRGLPARMGTRRRARGAARIEAGPASVLRRRTASASGVTVRARSAGQNMWLKNEYSVAESVIAAARVRTQASSRLRTVEPCRPEPFAAIVPATPDDSTWVVDTGRP